MKMRSWVFAGCVIASGCQDGEDSEVSEHAAADARLVDGSHPFPVRPGTSAWRDLQTHAEMLDALEVPVERLASMSTAEVVSTCLAYPLYRDLYAYEDVLTGFARMAVGFSGFAELMRRPDAGRLLLGRYEAIDPTAIGANWALVQAGDFDAEITNLEVLLAQEEILAILNEAEVRRLVRAGLSAAAAKAARTEVYGTRGQASAAFVVGRALWFDAAHARGGAFDDERVRRFVEDADWREPSAAQRVIDHAEHLE